MVLLPGCGCCGGGGGGGVCCPPTQEYIEAFHPLVCGQDGDIYSISLVKTPGDFNGTEVGDSFATGPVGGAVTTRVETPGIYWRLESDLPEMATPNATGWTWKRRYLTDISPLHADEDRGVYFRLDFGGNGASLWATFNIGCDLNDPDNLWLRLTVADAGTAWLPYLDLLWIEVGGVRKEVLPDPGVWADALWVEVKMTKSQAADMQIAAGWSLTNWPHPAGGIPPGPPFGHYELTLKPLPEPLQDWSCGPPVSLPECGDFCSTNAVNVGSLFSGPDDAYKQAFRIVGPFGFDSDATGWDSNEIVSGRNRLGWWRCVPYPPTINASASTYFENFPYTGQQTLNNGWFIRHGTGCYLTPDLEPVTTSDVIFNFCLDGTDPATGLPGVAVRFYCRATGTTTYRPDRIEKDGVVIPATLSGVRLTLDTGAVYQPVEWMKPGTFRFYYQGIASPVEITVYPSIASDANPLP